MKTKLLEETRKELEKKFPRILVKTKSMDLRTLTDPKVYEEFKGKLFCIY